MWVTHCTWVLHYGGSVSCSTINNKNNRGNKLGKQREWTSKPRIPGWTVQQCKWGKIEGDLLPEKRKWGTEKKLK